jgi:hypothetical protein
MDPPRCIRCENANWLQIGHSCGKAWRPEFRPGTGSGAGR